MVTIIIIITIVVLIIIITVIIIIIIIIGKKCPYSNFFRSALFCIRTEYEEIWSISPYSV